MSEWTYGRYDHEVHIGERIISAGTVFRFRRLSEERREEIERQTRGSEFYYPSFWELQRKYPDGTWEQSREVLELPGMD